LLSTDENAQKLKIFEDASRKGSNEVFGMERVNVTSAEDVIAILQKGSMKRQIAATKMNDQSRWVKRRRDVVLVRPMIYSLNYYF
jgi:kinesin family protein 11